ncbi:MAG: class I SAM-dependent methyltransferase [Planctomycetota bacterium]
MTGPDPDLTRAHWDGLAEAYDDAKARNSAYYDALKRLIDRAVPAAARARMLDLGCGTGQILAHLRPGTGLGLDASPAMIDRASKAFPGRGELTFEVADAAAIAGPGGFDAVVSADLLEHVPDWRGVVRAAVAACRPGGRIVLTTPNPAWATPLWILERLRLKMPEGPHRYVSRRAIADALRDEGCRIIASGTHLLVPARAAGLGPRLSAAAERLPVLRALGVIQLVAAERMGDRP